MEEDLRRDKSDQCSVSVTGSGFRQLCCREKKKKGQRED